MALDGHRKVCRDWFKESSESGELAFEFFEDFGQKCRVFATHKVFDPAGGEFEGSEGRFHGAPELVFFLSFGEIEVAHEFGEPLEFDGIKVAVVAIDDFALMGAEIAHRILWEQKATEAG